MNKKLELKWHQLKLLFNEYLTIISRDHHKNRDGQLSLTRYYFGWDEKDHGWKVVHNGYVNDFECKGVNEFDAINNAIIKLKGLIAEEEEFQRQQNEIND